MGIRSVCLEVFLMDWALFIAASPPSLGPFPYLPSDKTEDRIGLHQFKCIYMKGFAGAVTSAVLHPSAQLRPTLWLDELCSVRQP